MKSVLVTRLTEGLLCALALCFVTWQSSLLQERSQNGKGRWHADLTADIATSAEIKKPLISTWCERDLSANPPLRSLLAADQTCGESVGELSKAALLRRLRWQDAPSIEVVLSDSLASRWHDELLLRARTLRQVVSSVDSSDLSLLVLSEATRSSGSAAPPTDELGQRDEQVRLEEQAADETLRRQAAATSRLQQWDQVIAPALSESIARIPSLTPTEQLRTLWAASQIVDGTSRNESGRLVRRWLDAPRLALRAQQSLDLLSNVFEVLCAMGIGSYLMIQIARAGLHAGDRVSAILIVSSALWFLLSLFGALPDPLANPKALLGLMGAIALSWGVARWSGTRQLSPFTSNPPLSVWVLPSWFFFTAVGWLLLLDQSINFHPRLRFLALDQWRAWCLSSVLLALSATLSQPLLRFLHRVNAWIYRRCTEGRWVFQTFAGALIVVIFASLHVLHIPQYVTGELLKFMFVVAFAWFCVWKLPVSGRLWSGGNPRTAVRNMFGAAMTGLLIAVCALATEDRGPLLVICLVLTVMLASIFGWTVGILIIIFGFIAIFLLGTDMEVVGSRIRAWRDPFSADHDDMARLIWFRAKTAELPMGFGIGQVPWCGQSAGESCRGLPLQLQSDYTFTALSGWWGIEFAWITVTFYTWFCFRMVRIAARDANELFQPIALIKDGMPEKAMHVALLLIASALIVVQAWTTIAGNLGWVPLTGITWPLVSYGKSSLWISTMMIGWLAVVGKHA